MGTLVNGIKEIFATSQSTATHLPVCASDGTPQGRISVGDLASVLGVNAKAGSNGNVDTTTVNSKIANGFYQHPRAIREGGNWGVLFVYNGAGNYIVQLDWEFSTNAYFVRNSTNGGSSWTEWNSIYANIPSFYKNYSTFDSLSLALFGKRYSTNNTSTVLKTDLKVNSGEGGACIIVLASKHNDAGDATCSAIYMLRTGYSGNNVTSYLIKKEYGLASADTDLVVAYSNDGYITLSGFRKYIVISNV